MAQPVPKLIQRITHVLGKKPVQFRNTKGGYTAADRWICALEDNTSVFVKVATDETTAGWLRAEIRAYERMKGAFLPEVLGFDNEGPTPLLVLEDLSGFPWPPPWDSKRVEKVLQSMDEAHAQKPDLPPMTEVFGTGMENWDAVAQDPEPFHHLGLATKNWLKESLPQLLAAQHALDLSGESLLHMDIRSDNMCFKEDRAILIDWNNASLGNPGVDLGFWLPSLELEGGPKPDEILPNAPEVAAFVSGFFASRAGMPGIPHAPSVRTLQKKQLEKALPWVIRALELKPLPKK